MKTLLTRVATAVVAILIIIATYHFFKIKGLVFLSFIIVLLAQGEFTKIIFHEHIKSIFPYLFKFFLTLIAYFSVYSELNSAINMFLISLFTAILIIFYGKKLENEVILNVIAKSFLGFVYLGLAPAYAIKLLLDFNNGLDWFIAFLVIVFAGDTFAYLCGSLFGKRKLIPSISPKKSLEGSIGGLLGSIAAILICNYLYNLTSNSLGLVVLAMIVGFIAQWGDFFESLLKRVAQVKDSGNVMPGHGGILDRVDGVIFSAPAMYLGVFLIEKLIQ